MELELTRENLNHIAQHLKADHRVGDEFQRILREDSFFKKKAKLWHTLLCKDFAPGAKKTAFIASLILLSKEGLALEYGLKHRLVSAIIKVSKEKPELLKIERLIRYVATGN